MASNTTKVYRIEIEMSAAQQALADTIKKAESLDQQLEGLDSGSDAAKKITAEMAKLVGEIGRLEAQTEGFATQLDNLKPGTIPALEAEIEELEAVLRRATIGTAEFDEALLNLGNARGELKRLEDGLDAIADTKQHAGAFLDFANGVVGGFAVMTTAAQTWGLSQEQADAYAQKLLGLISVMEGVEQISKALNSETLSVVKSTLASGRAWLTASESASTGAKVTRAALISTGVGALVVLIGVLVANWDRLTASVKGSETFFTKVRAITSGLFDSAIASVKVFASLAADLFTGNIPALITDAKGAGKKIGDAYAQGYAESVRESNRKTLEGQIAAQDRLIEVLKARGVQTYVLEEANLKAKLALQKQGNEEEKKQYLDLQKDLDVLRATHAQKERADTLALTQARLSGVLALEQAAGRESFAAQLALEKQKLEALKAAADPQLAAIEAQQNAITALIVAKGREREEKRRALADAELQAQLIERRAQGGDEYQLTLDLNELQEQAAAKHLKDLRTAAQVDAAAVRLARAELFRIQLERADIFHAEELRQEEAHQQSLANERDGYQLRALIADKKHQADLLLAQKAAQDIAVQVAERARIAATPPLSLEDNFLIRVFGLHPLQLDKVKQAFASAVQNVGGLVSTLLAEGLANADVALQDAQARLSTLDQQLSERRSAAQETESQLADSVGAKRDYLLQKLAKERGEVERLASAKKKAADEEKRAAAEKEKIEKRQQALIAATTLATNVGTAAEAVAAGVKAVSAGSALPFPGNVFAIAAALAAVASAVASAKAFANTFADGTGALGSDGVLRGPSHTGGGVGLYNRYGHFFGEAEGGEAITPVDATSLNGRALELIRTQGRTRTLTPMDFAAAFTVPFEIAPPPAGYYPGHYANGTGSLGADSNGLAGGGLATSAPASAASVEALLAHTQHTNALLSQMLSHTATTADSTAATAGYGPPRIVRSYQELLEEDIMLKQAKAIVASSSTIK